MSNVQPGANAGAEQAESVAGAQGGNEGPAPLHESWVKALDEGGIPDLLRQENSPLIAQIRRSEAESNRRIEELSQRQAPQEWSGLLSEAQQQGVTPDSLIDGYNTALQMRQDPFAFIDALLTNVSSMVAAGQLTAPQGWQARYQAVLQAGGTDAQAQQVANAGAQDDFEDPRDKQLRELQERFEQREQADQQQREQQTQAELEAQEAADDEAYAEQFETTLRQQLAAGGFAPTAEAVPQEMLAAVASVAGQIDQATEDDIALPDLLGMAINQLKQLGMAPVAAPAQQQRQTIPPIGGGGGGRPLGAAGFDSKSARDQAMIAAAQAALAS